MGFGKVGNVGSCALVSLVIDNRLFVANLGDSKGILFKKDQDRIQAVDLNE